jgi:outer membrane protein assembly factor BamE (lipoprotein component of BamABCDE complex)
MRGVEFSTVLRTVTLGCVVAFVVACTETYRNSGYVPTEIELEQVQVGKSDRAFVEETVGRPITQGMIRDDTWYFVGTRWEYYAYKAPKPIDRQVVAISFNDKGTVGNVERFSLEDGRIFALNRRVTDSNIEGVSFLRQLLGNIGNLGPENFSGAAPSQ